MAVAFFMFHRFEAKVLGLNNGLDVIGFDD